MILSQLNFNPESKGKIALETYLGATVTNPNYKRAVNKPIKKT